MESALCRGQETRRSGCGMQKQGSSCDHLLRDIRIGSWSVAFSPDGKRIVSGSSDKTIRLWDAERGQLQPTLEGHQDCIPSVASSCLSLGSRDKTTQLSDVKIDLQLQRLQHLIRFSSQLEHGLFEPVELFDQISPSSPSGLVDVVTSSGWVRIGPTSSLLFWSLETQTSLRDKVV
jgi:WD40 repeat protein